MNEVEKEGGEDMDEDEEVEDKDKNKDEYRDLDIDREAFYDIESIIFGSRKFYLEIRMKIMMRTLSICLMTRMITLGMQINMRWMSHRIRITLELLKEQEKTTKKL